MAQPEPPALRDLPPQLPRELAEAVFAAKARRRTWLAQLPVEEKYRRFLQLQRMVSATQRAAGRPWKEPWPEG